MTEKLDILHNKPIDRVAVRVVFKKGENFERCIRSITDPVLGELFIRPLAFGATDYTGIEYGFGMKVIGYLGFTVNPNRKTNKRKHLWAVQCKCGRIERRSNITLSKQIRGKKQSDDRCESCKNLEKQRHYYFKQYEDENGQMKRRYDAFQI